MKADSFCLEMQGGGLECLASHWGLGEEGVVVMWDKVVQSWNCINGDCSIFCLFINRAFDKRWVFIMVKSKGKGR